MDSELVRGRPKRQRLDVITDGCGMKLHQLLELAQTHTTWLEWWQSVSRVLHT